MKKNYAFVLIAFVLLATSLVFAQNQNTETVEKMTGIRGIALRTYCSFSSLFGAKNSKCFVSVNNGTGNTAAIGAIGVGSDTPSAPSVPSTPGITGGQSAPASVGGFSTPVVPQVIERTVVVQGAPGPQGPAGAPGEPGLGAIRTAPQVFWGGGSSVSAPSSISPLPGGALPGQVLATNASGTVEWQYITIPSASNTPSILGSLANLFGINGISLATTSTSTTVKLGGPLTEDTTITQNAFNFGLARNGFGIVNQGTTTVSIAGGTLENSNFVGLTATEGTHNLYAGMFRRTAPDYPIYEVQAFDSISNRQGYSAIGNSTAQMGVTNGTTTNQLRADSGKIRLSSNTTGASSSQIRIDGNGIHFGFDASATNNGKTYSFPRVDGSFDGVMATDALGQLRFRTLLEILSTTSTSTLAQMPLWSTSGNTGTNSADNFLGTIDNQALVVKTNNLERARFAANGNFSLFTNDQNASSSITVKGIHGDGRWGIFDEANNKLLQNRSDAGILGFGTGDFVSYGFNSAMGIRGADVMIPHVVVGGNITGPNNISQLRMEASSQTEYNYAGSYPTGVNTYKISTNLSAPLPGFTRAPIAFGGRELNFFTGVDDTGIADMTIFENGNVGIGTTTASQKLTVNGGVQLNNDLVIKRPSGISEILFDNTTGSGDFRIRGNTNELLIQSGGGRNFQLAAWHGVVLQGGLNSGTIPAFETGTFTQFNTMVKNQNDSVGLIVKGNPVQTQDLLQLQNSAGTNLAVFTAGGNLGLGTNTPGFKIDSVVTTSGNNGFRQSSTNSTALGLVRLQNDLGAISQLSVYGSNHAVAGLRGNSGVGGSNDFFIYSDSETATGGTHAINFMTGGYSPSTQTRMKITGAGDVGIGTILPSTRLEVNSGIVNDSGFAFSQLNSGSLLSGTALNFLTVSTSGKVVLSALDPSVFATTSPAGVDGSVQFKQAGLFAANINFNWDNTNSRLGLGTSTPTDVLSIVNPTSNLSDRTMSWFRQNAARVGSLTNLGIETEGYLYARDTNNSYSANDGLLQTYGGRVTLRDSQFARDLWISSNDSTFEGGTQGFAVTYTGWDGGAGTAGTDAIFRGGDAQTAPQYAGGNAGNAIIRPGRHTDNSLGNQGTPADIIFQGYTTGIASNLFEAARFVGSTGDLGIGTSAPARKLHVAINTTGQVARFQNTSGTCNINPSLFLAFNCLSDRSLKKDITNLDSSLAAFSKLNPVTYHWNNEDSTSPLQYGFIAQEVEEIFPQFVSIDDETGLKSVAFGNLIPLSVKAISELNTHLGDLSKEVTPEEFVGSTIYKRFADAFKALTVAFKNITADKATVKELCLPKSDGTVICLTGDQVAQIAASAGVNPVPVVEEEIVPEPTPVDETPIDPSPVDPTPAEDPAPILSESPGNPAPEVDTQSESVIEETPAQEVVPQEVIEPAPVTE